jgi:hypothetical protein
MESSRRAKELRKDHPPRADIFSPTFLLKLERCYQSQPLDQQYSRQSILLRSEVVIPRSFTYFFSLPRELRNKIYFHALAPPTPKELIIKPAEPNMPQIWLDEMRIPPGCVFESGESDDWSGREEMTRLLRVNRQVYYEVSAVLYSDFRFVISPVSINTYPTLLLQKLRRGVGQNIRRLGIPIRVSPGSSDVPLSVKSCSEILQVLKALGVEFQVLICDSPWQCPSRSQYIKDYDDEWVVSRLIETMQVFRHLQVTFISHPKTLRPDLIQETGKRIHSKPRIES